MDDTVSAFRTVSTKPDQAHTEISEMLYDPTGLTRFYQMEAPDKLNWDEVNAINYDELWASVDHETDAPIKPLLPQVRERQEEVRPKDSAEIFYEQVCVADRESWTKASVVYEQYREFTKAGGFTAFNQVHFGNRVKALLLQNLGGQGVGWKNSNGVWYALRLTGKYVPQEERMDAHLRDYRAAQVAGKA